jgi:hypothetical protein
MWFQVHSSYSWPSSCYRGLLYVAATKILLLDIMQLVLESE